MAVVPVYCIHCFSIIATKKEIKHNMCIECFEFFTEKEMPDVSSSDDLSGSSGDDGGSICVDSVGGSDRDLSRVKEKETVGYLDIRFNGKQWLGHTFNKADPMKTITLKKWELYHALGHIQGHLMESMRGE